ncbi:MBL fold metallo-hydrolase [Hymenobacter sp. PAMC 26628]|nr:MBL fold metallo-hydrolase [Hymenobacter sp. PAMC 26628]
MGLLLAAGCWAHGAAAQQPAAPALLAQPGYYRMRLGAVLVTALADGTVPYPFRDILTHTTPAEVDRRLARADLTSPVEGSDNGYLLELGTRLVLIDTGAGDLLGPTTGHLLAGLRAAGYQPEQVTDVLLTHLHSDHAGGLVTGGQRVFPNATLHVSQADLDYCLSDARVQQAPASARPYFLAARAALVPYQAAGKVQAFTGAITLFPGLQAQPAPGHTPGHTSYVLASQGQKLAFLGDVLHAVAVQLPQPAVSLLGDTDQARSAATRQQAAADAARLGYWVALAHTSFPGIGHVRPAGQGYEWVPINYSLKGTGQ